MLGASAELKKINPNIIIDAKVSRQVSQAKDIVKNLEREGKLGDIVVILLYNNPVDHKYVEFIIMEGVFVVLFI